MEDVLAVYRLAHDPRFPVVCMDESSKQLVGEVRAPIPAAPGRGQIVDHEYVRHGVATLFVEVEPLAGRRHVEVTERRTRQDWARFIKAMLDERYPAAIKVRLVMDNLNTQDLASLYETFPPAEAPSGRALGNPSHAQARQLAEHRRDRAKRTQRPMPVPPPPRSRHHAS